ncbi:uncharacterized protein BO66DRAFT_211039 [Aspergillus aculeatinus CBS 121060]|uniref:Uncharacterized protein n=1 Tax=Aspergillus aculeatinus CBS 121060 TaxID=1448322 RepID=A0ACD1GVV9_9EURO|nr:hypothetical protein BO66DRAFT_211039 [Aspergillus aculeatinus CBS 121060]RAH65488.1 hypothetical protein BO66DRAFT_211039 [Aspergillus aculeatinus CBS 121060]
MRAVLYSFCGVATLSRSRQQRLGRSWWRPKSATPPQPCNSGRHTDKMTAAGFSGISPADPRSYRVLITEHAWITPISFRVTSRSALTATLQGFISHPAWCVIFSPVGCWLVKSRCKRTGKTRIGHAREVRRIVMSDTQKIS